MSRATVTTATGSPLEAAWAHLRLARFTEDGCAFIDALEGATGAAERCDPSDASLVMERVVATQRERGARLVPTQLGPARAALAYLDEQAADAAETD